MAEAGEKTSGSWIKYGCFGCLGLVAVVVLVIAGVAGIAMSRARSMQVEEQVLSRELPGVSPEALAADMPPLAPPPPDMPAAVPGQVELELSEGDFVVEPAEPGEPARVEATFDKTAYTLSEGFTRDDEGGWVYRVAFHRTARSSLLTSLSELISGKKPKVHIFLPRDVPMDLDLEVTRGGGEVDLGGLWLVNGKLDFTMGGVKLDFAEPLARPAESLSIHGSMGGAALMSLGNASPARLDVDFQMGGMHLDLRGRWTGDARIDIQHGMGGGNVKLPRNVNIRGLDAYEEEAPDPNRPTLTFTTSSRMEDLQFDR